MNKLPKSLKPLIEKKNDRLRVRRFVISRPLMSISFLMQD
jgi:hypothetical protein